LDDFIYLYYGGYFVRTFPVILSIVIAGTVLANMIMDFSNRPFFPSILNPPLITAFLPGCTRSLGHSAKVQSQDVFTSEICRASEPVLVNLKSYHKVSLPAATSGKL
jgi:hypothetical protein